MALPASKPRSSFVFFYYPSFHASLNLECKLGAVGGAETSAESAGADRDAGKDAPLPQHNTMADLAMKNPEACDLPFGEYMLRKWVGVQRGGVGGSGEGDEKPSSTQHTGTAQPP